MSKYDKYIGELFDGVYKIEKIIGVGGMAVVFQAYDTVNDRVVAIKMLREEMNEKRYANTIGAWYIAIKTNKYGYLEEVKAIDSVYYKTNKMII